MTHITDDDPIPTMPPVDHAPPVRNDEELRQRWRALMGPGGFGRHSLWVFWLDDEGRQLPVVMPIDDIPDTFSAAELDQLGRVLQAAGSDADSVALLFSRPGPSTITAQDRARTRGILQTFGDLAEQGDFTLTLLPIHLATPNSVRPITADDLV